MNSLKLSQHFHGCIRLAQQHCLGSNLKKQFDFTEQVKDAGWVPPDSHDRFFRKTSARYYLYDIVLGEWLSIPVKPAYEAGELLDWAFLFARLQGYAKEKLPRRMGRPSKLTARQQEAAIDCMADARGIRAEQGVSLSTAALRIMEAYGFKASQAEYNRIRLFAHSKNAK